MESIRQIYRIGQGPSSSHTMGPRRAASIFLEKISGKRVTKFVITLYGSLAATGRGHLTDRAILEGLGDEVPTEIIWKPKEFLSFHPNGMLFEAFADGNLVESWQVFSI